MKIFISWSGQTSKNIAEIYKQWIQSVIQAVRPYYSPDDMVKGTRWSTEIAKELEESKVGIICLTKDNLQNPWIMFEAGALSKNIDKSKVCPLLFGVEPNDMQGPLVQFQAAKFTKDDMKKVVKMINVELNELALSTEVFENAFELWWPKLYDRIDAELNKQIKTHGKELRDQRDILDEILTLTRAISISRDRIIKKDNGLHPDAIADLVFSCTSFLTTSSYSDNPALWDNLERLLMPVQHIVRHADIPTSVMRDYLDKLEKVDLEIAQIKSGS